MGDKFKSVGGQQQTATGNAKIINNHFTAQKESVAPSFKPGTLFNVPDLPPNYFPRPDDLKEFRAALLAEGTQAVGITGKRQHVGVQGMGGLGKSVLAAALAHDEDVRAAFPDGIFWLRFRQDADDAYLLEQQAEILKILAPDQLPDTLAYGENLLNLALQNKRCLFIADDLWDSKYLRHFNVKSIGCRFLLTTRNAEVIKKTGAHKCELGLLSDTQAREFLALSSGCAENALPDEAAAILRECGRLPLAVAAIGSMVKGKPAQRWQTALEKLQNARLDKIPANLTDDYNYKSLFKVFEVSVDDLPPEVQAYYKTLIIFPEDAKIPESVLQLYWEHCQQGDYEPLDAVDLLVERSLLARDKNEFVTLHDLLRDYLRHQSGGDVANLHKQLLEAYKAKYPGGWHTIPYKEPYYFHFHWHLHAQATGDMNLLSEIADDLIRNQPVIGPEEIDIAFRFSKYHLPDDAPYLLKESKNTWVLIKCLSMNGYDAKEDAERLAKETDDSFVFEKCIEIFKEKAKEICKVTLKESGNLEILEICLKFLGNEAKEGARYLLNANKDELLRLQCIELLGIEAKDAALRLIDTTQDKFIPQHCMDILNSWEKDDTEEQIP
jgi:hypothetical protein